MSGVPFEIKFEEEERGKENIEASSLGVGKPSANVPKGRRRGKKQIEGKFFSPNNEERVA
jgi:hypothetical protein